MALEQVERDNETIYCETVPATVHPVPPFVLAKPTPGLGDALAGDFASDPWSSLVSQDEYTALQHYQQQEKVLRETIARSIEEATSAARAKLVEWDLPGTLDS